MMNMKVFSLFLLLVLGVTLFSPFINVEAVGTQFTTTPIGTHFYERHSWYSSGRFWVFYSTGAGTFFTSSVDGVTWAAPTSWVAGVSFTQRMDSVLASDQTTIHLVAFVGVTIYYRMGTCNSDGTITWSQDFQTFGGNLATEVSLALDSSGFPTIIFNGNGETTLKSIRSTTNNGLFNTGGEGVQTIQTVGEFDDIEGKALSIGNQNLYIVYTKDETSGLLYGKRYDFATKAWGVEETITTSNVREYRFSLVSDGTVIYLSWNELITGNAYGAYRSATGVWTEFGDISGEAIMGTPAVVRDSNFGGAWVLWANVATNIKIRHISPLGELSTAKFIKNKGANIVETGILGLEVIEITNDLNHLGIIYPTATGTSFDMFNIYSDFYITNMEGSDVYGEGLKLISVEEEFYLFQLDVTGIISDPVEYASVRFYNNGNLIQVDYNATTGLTTVVSGEDYIILHETETVTSGDTLSIIWSIWLKSTLLDKENMDIETYFSLNSGITLGWETYPSYCDLYNIGGYVSTSVSGAQTTTSLTTTVTTTTITQSSNTFYTTSSLTTPSTVTTSTVTTTTATIPTTTLTSRVTTTITTTTNVSCITLSVTTSSPSTVITTTLTTTTDTPLVTTLTSRVTSSTVYTTSFTSSTILTSSVGTFTLYPGLAGRSAGGDVFDLYVYPNSMSMGKVAFRDLTNVHALFNIYTEYYSDWWLHPEHVEPVEIGLDYWTGTEYVTGWSVKIELTHADITNGKYTLGIYSGGAAMCLTWHIDWYYNGVFVKDDNLNTYPMVTSLAVNNPVTTSFIVDLWYNKMNSSSVVGGRITAEYYGVVDNSSFLLRWFSGTNYIPVLASTSSDVLFFHNLENGAGDTISYRDIEMSYFWAKITQGNNVDFGSTLYRNEIRDWNVLEYGIDKGGSSGINTPPYVATKVHSMPQVGFLNGLMEQLAFFVKSNAVPVASVLGWLGNMAFDFVDTILGFFGLSGVFRTILSTIVLGWNAVTAYLISSFNMIFKLFEVIYLTFGYIVYIFTSFIDTTVDIIVIVVGIFNGTYTIGTATAGVLTGLGNMWTTFNLATAFPLITLYIIVDWLGGLKGSFGQMFKQAYEDVQVFLGVTVSVFSFIISTFLNIVLRLIEFIVGLKAAI